MRISGPVVGESFVNRRAELAALEEYAVDRQFCCLLGLRRTGKTSIMLELSRRLRERPERYVPVYFNIQPAITVPEQFVVAYVGALIFGALKEMGIASSEEGPFYNDLHYVQRKALAFKSERINDYLLELGGLLSRRELNYQQLFQVGFGFAEVLAKALERPLAVFLDEFQEVVQFKAYNMPVLALFRGVTQAQTRVWYCLAGSSITMLNRLINSEGSPLFGQYRTFLIGPFAFDATRDLASKIVGHTLPAEFYRQLYGFTRGYPFYLTIIGTTVRRLLENGMVKAEDALLLSILEEIYNPVGTVALHCKEIFSTFLQMATQSTISRSIMLFLANKGESASASEVARKVGRSRDFVRQVLMRLVEVDLLQVTNRRYMITDPILAFWLAHNYSQFEADPMKLVAFEENKERLLTELRSEIAKLRSERGFLYESYVRDLVMRTFDGRRVRGNILGQEGFVVLPKAERVLNLKLGQDELDMIIVTETGNWLVEIKGRRSPAKYTWLRQLQEEKKSTAEREGYEINTLWFISEGGFSRNAIRYARRNGILFTEGGQLSLLESRN